MKKILLLILLIILIIGNILFVNGLLGLHNPDALKDYTTYLEFRSIYQGREYLGVGLILFSLLCGLFVVPSKI